LRCPTRKRSADFCATHLPVRKYFIKSLAQRGPDEAAERLRAERGGGRIAIKVQFSVWSRDDGTPFPNFSNQHVTEPDIDDLFPEGYVTKQFWENLDGGIEQWRRELKYK